MRTFSHFLIAAGLGAALRRQDLPHLPSFLAGSVLPDVPLALLVARLKVVRSRPPQAASPIAPADRFQIGCDVLFREDPLWIASYGLPHAPPVIAALWLVGMLTERRRLRWLALGLALHSSIDILTHYDDGPLLFFPFDWRYRFPSPVSYWDPARFGRAFTVFEYGLDLLLAAYFLLKGARVWLIRQR